MKSRKKTAKKRLAVRKAPVAKVPRISKRIKIEVPLELEDQEFTEMWGFVKMGGVTMFTDVYGHRSMVFYETKEGAEKVKEFGEKVVKVRVKISYAS